MVVASSGLTAREGSGFIKGNPLCYSQSDVAQKLLTKVRHEMRVHFAE